MVNIAVVEDTTILRRGISQILSNYDDFNVVMEAASGKEFLDLLETGKYKVDVCLLDIVMPEMDGYQTIEIIKKKHADVKVLVLSMYDDDYNIIRMLRRGANGYIIKNSNPEELSNAVREVNSKGFYHSEFLNDRMVHLLQQPDDGIKNLSDKEIQFLSYCCSELTYKEMAELMQLSPRTVEGYRDDLCKKLNIKSRTGLVMFAMSIGIIPFEEKI